MAHHMKFLALYNINSLQELSGSVETTRGQLKANCRSYHQVRYIPSRCFFSLLLLCIGLNPLSQTITKTGYRYHLWSGATNSQLLHMNDAKLYARNDKSLIHISRIYSNNIRMSSWLDECGWMVSKRQDYHTGRGWTAIRPHSRWWQVNEYLRQPKHDDEKEVDE